MRDHLVREFDYLTFKRQLATKPTVNCIRPFRDVCLRAAFLAQVLAWEDNLIRARDESGVTWPKAAKLLVS